MIDYDGNEPTDEQVLSTRIPTEDAGENYHERLVMALLRSDAVDGIYRHSAKRLVLATGLPRQDIEAILFILAFQGYIEVDTGGIKLLAKEMPKSQNL